MKDDEPAFWVVMTTGLLVSLVMWLSWEVSGDIIGALIVATLSTIGIAILYEVKR